MKKGINWFIYYEKYKNAFVFTVKKNNILRFGVWGRLGASTRVYISCEYFHTQNGEKIFHSLKEEIILQYLYEFKIKLFLIDKLFVVNHY